MLALWKLIQSDLNDIKSRLALNSFVPTKWKNVICLIFILSLCMTLFEIFKVTIYMPFDPKNTKSVFFCLHFAFFCLHFTIFYERRTNNIFQCFIVGNVYTEFICFTAIKTVLKLSSLVDKKNYYCDIKTGWVVYGKLQSYKRFKGIKPEIFVCFS
jgi:hypothetical protein